ncbi:MAG: OsmC family protein [Candidatus Rokubacteria bacterium]|nr:OsmC family protein [Candidatus Rokubacteria bacterium]
MEARKIPAGEGRLSSEAAGEIEVEDRVLVIKRIRVRYDLRLRADQREAAERAHAAHREHCPVARTLRGCVEIATELHVEEEA